jgi:hypothetical protein
MAEPIFDADAPCRMDAVKRQANYCSRKIPPVAAILVAGQKYDNTGGSIRSGSSKC